MNIRILQNGIRVYPFSATVQNLKKTFPGVSFPDNPSAALLQEYGVYPVQDTRPEYDTKKQKLVRRPVEEFVFLEGKYHTAYDVVSLTEEEFNQQQPSENRPIDEAVVKKLLIKQFEQLTIPDEELDEYASLFPAFKVGEAVVAGDRRQYEGAVWQVIQPHTTQLDWLPPDVPALWGRVYSPEVIPLWVQPYGAGDPNIKQVGDKVQWPEGTIWISTEPDNIWEPGVYGWDLFEG
jgi:hypothetical protein